MIPLSTILGIAVRVGDATEAERLLHSGARPTSELLRQAIHNHDAEIVDLLLSHGAKIAETHSDPFTLLLDPDRRSPIDETVKVLLRHGQNLNRYDSGLPILVQALYYGRSEHVASFLACGADPNLPSGAGQTTFLHHVVNLRHEYLTKLALEYGANPNQPDRFGVTPLAECLRPRNRQLTKLLLDNGGNPWSVEPIKPGEDLVLRYRWKKLYRVLYQALPFRTNSWYDPQVWRYVYKHYCDIESFL